MKETFEVYIESEQGEIEIKLEANILTWEREIETPTSPPVAAGFEIEEVYVIAQPDLESVRALIREEAGEDEFMEVYKAGITFMLDKNKGVAVDDFDNDTLSDYITILEASYENF